MLPWVPQRVGSIIALLCGLSVCVSLASAQVDAQIDWRAPQACPTADDVRARVSSLLSRHTSATQLRASGAIAPAASHGYVLTLVVHVNEHRASRTLRASDCASLSDAGAWLIALAVDPALMSRTGEPDKSPAEPATPNAEEAESAPVSTTIDDTSDTKVTPARDAAQASRTPIALSARAGAFIGVYSIGLPAPALTLGMRMGLGFLDHFYAELALGYALSRSDALEQGAAIELASLLTRVRGCMTWGDRLRILPCAALTGFRSAGRVKGITAPSEDHALWLTGGAALGLAYMVHKPFELLLDAGADLPLSARPRFEVDGLGTVATGSFVSVHTTFGLGVRF